MNYLRICARLNNQIIHHIANKRSLPYCGFKQLYHMVAKADMFDYKQHCLLEFTGIAHNLEHNGGQFVEHNRGQLVEHNGGQLVEHSDSIGAIG